MKISITINTNNAAFEVPEAGEEVARILRELAQRVSRWPGNTEFAFSLRDINGNRVGSAEAQ